MAEPRHPFVRDPAGGPSASRLVFGLGLALALGAVDAQEPDAGFYRAPPGVATPPRSLPMPTADTGQPEIRGTWRQGEVLFARVAPGTRLRLNGRLLETTPDGRTVFGLDRDEPSPARLEVLGADGRTLSESRVPVATRQYRIQRLKGFSEEQVSPPPALLARTTAEAAEARAARQVASRQEDAFVPFAWPARGPITGVYGSQRVLNGEARQPHYGVDVAGPVGAPVRAPAGGTVTLAAPDMYFSGGTIMVDHGYGLGSSFLHLSRLDVVPGQRVEAGQVIGAIGKTGRVTGPHLDWRMHWFDARVDAERFAGPMPK